MKAAVRNDVVRPSGFAYRRAAASASHSRSSSLSRFPLKGLHCESVSLAQLAEQHGTPLYVYSSEMIRARLRAFDKAFRSVPHTICYSVKANSALGILRLLDREGAGFDVVSGGELERVLRVRKMAAKNVVFSGVGKTVPEMELALKAGIRLFNVESESELRALAATATHLKKRAAIAMRVNPDVPAKTHPYISTGLHQHKFGVPISEARSLFAEAARQPYLQVAGVSVHIGSQITDVSSFSAALARVADLVRELRQEGHEIQYVDAGGGLGISYEGEPQEFDQQIAAYANAVIGAVKKLNVHLLLEPGRSIVGAAGLLLTRVIYRKTNGRKRFLIVDAGMNDLLRPSLYGAHHEIISVLHSSGVAETTDVVGPVCETGDFFARDRELPVTSEGDLLAILDAGAYGAALGSNYNTRGRATEVMVDGLKATVIRRRESTQDQLRLELL